MAGGCYQVTREDAENTDLGTYDRLDEAERVAEDDAAERDYSLNWTRVLHGKQYGAPSTKGRDVYRYTITTVPCE